MKHHHEHCGCHHRWGFFRIIGGAVVAALFALVFGLVVMHLWNWLMPAIFGLKIIGYWQAFGMILLARLLFSGFGGHHGRHKFHPGFGHHHAWQMHKSDDEWAPAGNHRNWIFYNKYWKERGKKDFEDYLRESGRVDKDKNENATEQ